MKTATDGVTETPTMYETENDLPKSARSELNALINQRLAQVVDLQMQLKQAHWNVKGPNIVARSLADPGSLPFATLQLNVDAQICASTTTLALTDSSLL
jgi:hypothetical protein